jgi:hypothetical protein
MLPSRVCIDVHDRAVTLSESRSWYLLYSKISMEVLTPECVIFVVIVVLLNPPLVKTRMQQFNGFACKTKHTERTQSSEKHVRHSHGGRHVD